VSKKCALCLSRRQYSVCIEELATIAIAGTNYASESLGCVCIGVLLGRLVEETPLEYEIYITVKCELFWDSSL
jgi:hypothetical protein